MHLSAQPPWRPYMFYLLLWGLTYSTVITCEGYYSLCWRVGERMQSVASRAGQRVALVDMGLRGVDSMLI